jgi:hypothetical protein
MVSVEWEMAVSPGEYPSMSIEIDIIGKGS